MAKHTSVALPEALQQAVKNTIAAHPELGYTSIAEFCKDAIRSKIAEVEQRTAK
ncbi:MAG: ribbon-helix-helix domain-containing protein [Thermoplasmatota archaeon]